MLTIFSTPKPFRGHIDVIQRNAIQSWLALEPHCEVILFGDDEGTAEVAAEYGVRHVPNVPRNEFGTPLLSFMFEQAEVLAKSDVLCYVNCDMMFLPDFVAAVTRARAQKPRSLIVGRRWDVDITERLDFASDWRHVAKERAATSGKLHDHTGIDYFVYPKGALGEIPEFAVGRAGWDNWMIYNARRRKVPVIDLTQAAQILHQNHDYRHHPGGQKGAYEGTEAKRNIEIGGGWVTLHTLHDADFRLTPTSLRRNVTPYAAYRRLVTASGRHAALRPVVRAVRAVYRVIRRPA